MTKTAIITFVGDLCLTGMWLHFYENVWKGEVDVVRACLNGHSMSDETIRLHKELFAKHPEIDFQVSSGGDHGFGLKKMVEESKEDSIVFMEDDSWPFVKGALSEQFEKLENGKYELIGSPRTSIDMAIYEAQKKVQPELSCTDSTGVGDNGCNFWPCFLFVTRDALLKTDLHFWGKVWNKGDYIKEIDYTVEKDGSGADTGSWVCMQLRSFIPLEKVGLVKQYKCYPHDPILKENKQWTFEGTAKWIHAGSISSGINRYLLDDNGHPIRDFFKKEGEHDTFEIDPSELSAKDDLSMRTAFWQLCLDYSGDFPPLEYKQAYKKAIENFKMKAELSDTEVNKRYNIYKELLGL